MARYIYQHDLPFRDNKRLAIEAHSVDGLPVPINVGDGMNSLTTAFLFPDGAILSNEAGAMPEEPAPKPHPRCSMLDWESVAFRETVKRRLRYHQLVKERADKQFKQLYEEQMQEPTEDGVKELERLFYVSANAAGKIAQLERELTPPAPVLVPLTPAQQAEVKRTMERSAALHARVARLPAPRVSDKTTVN